MAGDFLNQTKSSRKNSSSIRCHCCVSVVSSGTKFKKDAISRKLGPSKAPKCFSNDSRLSTVATFDNANTFRSGNLANAAL